MSDWQKALATALVAALLGGGTGAGGTYALINWRLGALESTMKEVASRDQAMQAGAMESRLRAVEARVNDSALTDWVGWRTATDARLSVVERAIAEDNHGPLWRAIREIREGR